MDIKNFILQGYQLCEYLIFIELDFYKSITQL